MVNEDITTQQVQSPPLVYALVLNWNGADEAVQCLHSLAQQTYPNLCPFLVDNGSVDDSIAQIQASFPNLPILTNENNLGFAGGVNVGLRYALAEGADYVLVLNNDLVLDSRCVEEMVAQAKEGVAFVTAVIYYHDEPNRIWSIGGNINPWNLEKTADARGQTDTGQFPAVMERHFVPGGATLMARGALETVGLFDERFFLYYEDADLSLRAHRAGLRSVVATRAKMWHGISKSSGGSDSPRERYWMARSSVIYFGQNARVWQMPVVLFWRGGSAIRTSWRLFHNKKKDSLKSYWRGILDGLKDSTQKRTS
jgi:GT2 family glycosyltransferase